MPAAKALSTSSVTSTPKMAAVARRGGGTPWPASSAWPGSAARRRGRPRTASPGSRERATALTGSQGRRSSGVASTAASLTIAARASPARRAPRCCRPARPGRGARPRRAAGRAGTASVRRASVRACSDGQPAAYPRGHDRGRGAPLHRKLAITNAKHVVGDGRPVAPSTELPAERVGQHQHGRDPAAPAGDDGARCGLPVIFQTTARSTRPPSSGSPGTRLRTPTTRLAPARPLDGQVEQRAVGGQDREREHGDADRERGQRADHRDAELAAAGCPARRRSR